VGRIELAESISSEVQPYLVHPALLDAALRVVAVALPEDSTNAPRLLTRLRKLVFFRRAGSTAWVHMRLGDSRETILPSSTLFDDAGQVLLAIEGLETRIATEFRQHAPPRTDVYYSQVWESAELPALARERSRGRWLLLCDEFGLAESVRESLLGRGHDVVSIWSRKATVAEQSGRREIDPTAADDVRALIGQTLRTGAPLAGIIHCWGLSPQSSEKAFSNADLESALSHGCASALYVAQALSRMAVRDMPRLWLICRGTQAIPNEPAPINPVQAPLWGLGRMIALEYPELRCTRIDLDSRSEPDAEQLVREFMARDNKEEELVFRGQQRFVGRLKKVSPPVSSNAERRLDPDRSYLVTGGLGAMGLLGAKCLVQAGARHIVLMDNAAATTQSEHVAELASSGAEVNVVRADVTDGQQVANVFREINQTSYRLAGIIHCAGALDGGALGQQTIERLRKTTAPRMLAGANLHLAALDEPLDFIIFFSSLHALLGSPNLGGDVLGNVFLDALAHYRNAQGLITTSIDWGRLGIGMSARLSDKERMAEHGMTDLSAEESAALFRLALRERWTQIGIASLDARRWLESHPQAARSPRFRSLLEKDPSSELGKTSGAQSAGLLDELKKLSSAGREALIEDFLRQQLAAILRMEASRMERLAPLRHLGIDSLMSLELRNRLETALGIPLSATLVWSHPTIAAMSKHILSLLAMNDATQAVVEQPMIERFAEFSAPVVEDESIPMESSAADDELFKSFDMSLQRMRNRRKS